jgi:predicted metal-dependent hydrolase
MADQPTFWDFLGIAAPAQRAPATTPVTVDTRAAGLPDYEVRVHPRARRVLIRVRAGRPVLVTLPRGVAKRHAAEAIREHSAWIETTRARVESEATSLAARRAEPVPSMVELAGLSACYVVERRHSAGTAVRVTMSAGRVLLSGAVSDEAAVAEAMRRWVRRTASRGLSDLAADLAVSTGCTPADVTVCWPRSRWGSCSAAGRVRLSTDLVFVKPQLARSVILHEFAHLAVLDHSPRFYARLAELDPRWREHRAALRVARDDVPGWAVRE